MAKNRRLSLLKNLLYDISQMAQEIRELTQIVRESEYILMSSLARAAKELLAEVENGTPDRSMEDCIAFCYDSMKSIHTKVKRRFEEGTNKLFKDL